MHNEDISARAQQYIFVDHISLGTKITTDKWVVTSLLPSIFVSLYYKIKQK